jgi:hypothetical protein
MLKMAIKFTALWDVMLCSFVDRYQRSYTASRDLLVHSLQNFKPHMAVIVSFSAYLTFYVGEHIFVGITSLKKEQEEWK